MSDFTINIDSKLDISNAKTTIDTFINSYKNTPLKINVEINPNSISTANLGKQIQSSFSNAGTNAGKAYSNALQTQINTMARTQRTAFSEPLKNITKQQQSYVDWWEKSLNKKTFTQLDATKASNSTLTWLKNNSKAAKDYGDVLTDLAAKQKTATNPDDLKNYTKQVNAIKAEANALGKTGRSFTEEIGRGFIKIGQFAYTYGAIYRMVNKVTSAVRELKEVDSILTEISKVSDMTDNQIKQLGKDAFDYASQYGKKVKDYLQGVTEMNRSGFYGQQGIDLANTSVLAQAAGDMTADVANSYLLATNAAYEYAGSAEKLNTVLDGQNMITNKNSVNMTDMAEATSKAASMAAQTGVQVNELSAIIGTAVSRTKQGGDVIGTALKSLFINLQDTSNSKIVGTFNDLGISQTKFVNGSEQLKTPIELLKELANAYNNLPDGSVLKSDVLRNIGNKRQANVLAAILAGIGNGDYDNMLQDYSEGMGSAAREAEKSANNWEGSVNKLSNAWTSLIQNFANSDAIITATNLLTGLVKEVDKFASFPSVLGLIGGYRATKSGLGKRNAVLYKIEQNNRRSIIVENFLAS